MNKSNGENQHSDDEDACCFHFVLLHHRTANLVTFMGRMLFRRVRHESIVTLIEGIAPVLPVDVEFYRKQFCVAVEIAVGRKYLPFAVVGH